MNETTARMVVSKVSGSAVRYWPWAKLAWMLGIATSSPIGDTRIASR